MRIRIGEISARCEHCGGEEFQALTRGAVAGHELACFECGSPTSRRVLMGQIAQQTMKRAESLLARSRKPPNTEPHKP